MEIDLLIFETLPQPLDKDIVPPPSGSIHADLNSMSPQKPGEFLAGELAALIRVENFWGTIAGDNLQHRVHTEIRGQRIGEPPRQHPATRPVEDRAAIDEASFSSSPRFFGSSPCGGVREARLPLIILPNFQEPPLTAHGQLQQKDGCSSH